MNTSGLVKKYDESLEAIAEFDKQIKGRLTHAIEQSPEKYRHSQYFGMRKDVQHDNDDTLTATRHEDEGDVPQTDLIADMQYILEAGGIYDNHHQSLVARLEAQKKFFQEGYDKFLLKDFRGQSKALQE